MAGVTFPIASLYFAPIFCLGRISRMGTHGSNLTPRSPDGATSASRRGGGSPWLDALGGGEMAARVRTFDWGSTALGPSQHWPPSLRTAVGICLSSRIPMIIWWGQDLTLIYNDAYVALLGARHPCALGRSGRDVWAEAWPHIGAMVTAVTRHGESILREREHFVLERNGKPEDAWFTFSFTPIPDDHVGIGGMLNTAIEETSQVLSERDRARMTAELAEARARLDSTLPAAEVGTWTWHVQPNRIIADRNLARMFGVSESDAAGGSLESYLQAVHPDDREEVASRVAAAIRDGQHYESEYRLLNPHGHVRWVIARGQIERDAQGNAVRLPGVVVDITARKLAEEQLRRNHDTFYNLIQNNPFGVFVVDADFKLRQASLGSRRVFSNVRPLLGRDFAEVLRTVWPEPFASEAIGRFRHTLATGEPYASPGTVERRHDTADVEAYDWRIERLTLPDGRFGVVCYFYDLSERQRLEAALRESETRYRLLSEQNERLLASERAARAEAEAANRSKDRFLAVLSHELRTPLSPVVMTIPAIELDPDLPFKFREDLALVRRNIDLEVKLIDDLLDLSRVTSGKLRLQMQPVRVHDLLRHVIQSSLSDTSGKRLHVRHELDAVNDRLTADPARLQQVFWNLLRNSVKFTPAGGEIIVRTSNATGDGARLVVEISDSGVGIPPDVLPRIFDAFEQGDQRMTRQFGGLGLGLAIAKAVVEMHAGTITAASAGCGLGATFTVGLDTSPAHAREEPPAGAGGEATTRREAGPSRVLLVEDHPDTARVLARLLGASGYDVRTAHSMASALHLAAAEPFDVVVSDIGLPDATGYELMEQIRQRHGIKGIALSGYGMEEDMRRSREAGFIDHIVKPVNVAQLEAVIRRVTTAD